MADNEQQNTSTHLIHYFLSLGPGQMTFASLEVILPNGWTPANCAWALDHLTEKWGTRPTITGVTAYDRPTTNPDALREALTGLADAADAGASNAVLAEGLRRIVGAIK